MAEVAKETIVDGRYRITGRIGSGGMADVYCADDTHLGREVALKILHRRFSADAEFVERFRREASAAAGLQHPNVVSVFDRGAHDGTYYIAMENVKGRTLKQLVQQDAPLDQRRAIDLTIQILQAASFAHKRGVIHRDFKPHNVIVAADDSAKVTDFGIARAGASEMTETGSIMGTAQYLSPEQAQGQKVDARSDLYSIGVLLFELLTGRVPFSGESAVSIALKHVSEPAPLVSTLRPDIHPALVNVVGRALVKDQAGRFQTAEEFILALDDARRAIASGAPGEHTSGFVPVGPPPGDEEGGDRSKWPFIALALLALALVAAALLNFGGGDKKAQQTAVPRVTGLTVQRATARLKAAGFQVKLRNERNNAKPGKVLGSDPKRGARVDKGSVVTLIVSGGPGQLQVPTVDGFSQSRAQKTLTKAGFVFEVRSKSSSSVTKDNVIRTDPPGGTTVPYGSRVLVYVSTGPKQVSVPKVVGLTSTSATKALESRGFTVALSESNSDRPQGEVLAQSLAPGTQVDEGSEVRLTISKGQPKVQIPDLTGLSKATATAALKKRGLKVDVQEVDTTDPTQVGKVIDQSPGPNSDATKGDPVTIKIGKAPADSSNGGSTTPAPPSGTTP